ncbi:hypothetical protein F5Y14DRAFT_413881 [Nemania sp. NC0429]|nr:hypothetical protein F5Y14DRAFT_413881 [Nemania sp. NC0429]
MRAWPYPRGAAGDDALLVAKWKNGQLLRLLPGDPAASAWRIAKESFYGVLTVSNSVLAHQRSRPPQTQKVRDPTLE